MNRPNFYTVIPAFVRYNKDLTDFDKLMYGEIAALTNANNYCWASNSYFARVFSKSDKTIQRSIARLLKANVILSTINAKNGNERILRLNTPMDKNDPTPMDKNVPTRARDFNSMNNTRVNNKVNQNQKNYFKDKNKKPFDTNVEWFDDYLRELNHDDQKDKAKKNN